MLTITRYTKKFAHYLRNNKAVSALEYAILVGIIAIAISAAIVTFSTSLDTAIDAVGSKVTSGSPKTGVPQ